MIYAKYRNELSTAGEALRARFENGAAIADLVRERAHTIDNILTQLWKEQLGDAHETAALVAVGGYGRGELHPCSDVDVMILLSGEMPAGTDNAVAAFVTSLWDIGLEIGHSVRTVAQCYDEAKADIVIATTLMESRCVVGPMALFKAMQIVIGTDRMWPSAEFFEAKRKEQIVRHHRYDDTAYNLEPNVKGSPGGLRDIQMIAWVAKRHFGATTLAELVEHRFLTPGQLQRLIDGEEFLWRIRFALHVLTGRREDRLLFDHQSRLAEMLGYEDASFTLAVEQLMQRYYRTVMELSRLNEMLLQQFEEAILMDPGAPPQPLNERFQIRNGFLQTVDENVFKREPSAMLELFLLLQQHPDLRGVSAYTVGSIKRHLHLIDDEFRQTPRNQRLFLSIIRAPEGVTHELRRMNLYGVLGLYIPSFGRIVGRMQYDLFHAYTVDEHSLFVVSNLRRFALQRFDEEFPDCSAIMQDAEKPELIYLGGLFHDIAKGRGGDHSELGAVDAQAFCREHGLSQCDADTVAWLVRNHLILSTTAQKKDLGDPDVINEFAKLVGDTRHLDYLYLLTVADVRATSPKLWNSWKAQLFGDLYNLTKRALNRGLEHPIASEQLTREKQDAVHSLLSEKNIARDRIENVWARFDANYFLRHRSEEIAWHTEWLADSDTTTENGIVDIRRRNTGDGVEAVLYTPQTRRTFAHATAVLDELGLTIVDARIVPLQNGFSIDTYIFMELDQRVELDESRMNKIRRSLTSILSATDDTVAAVTRPITRQARMFTTETRLAFSPGQLRDQTLLDLIVADRPGLLSKIGKVFIEQGINITSAKIMTIGERAEDVFNIGDLSGKPLDSAAQADLETALRRTLD
jgi:[protein-PII] uridylyltransferase